MIPKDLKSRFLIVGEGERDEAFFRKLIEHHALDGFAVGFAQGNNRFGDVLGGLKLHKDFSNLPVVVLVSDNDEDPAQSFRNVQDQIRSAIGYGVPSKPLELASTQGFPNVAVMMLPWVDEKGALESVCLGAAYDKWPDIKRCLEDYDRCTSTEGWGTSNKSKMLLTCLIATACKTDPNTGLKYCWSRPEDLIPLNRPHFNRILSFLRELTPPSR